MLYPWSPSPSARICAPSRALRSLLEKIWRTPLAQGWAAIARMRARPRSLSGQSGTGMPGSIATSGWVIKNTVGIGDPRARPARLLSVSAYRSYRLTALSAFSLPSFAAAQAAEAVPREAALKAEQERYRPPGSYDYTLSRVAGEPILPGHSRLSPSSRPGVIP